MYQEYLNDYIILDEEDVYKAHWKLHKNGGILLVCNRELKFEGVITFSDMAKTYNNDQLTVKEICNTDCKYIVRGDKKDSYVAAKYIFMDHPRINQIPVLNEHRDILDMLTRGRVFWEKKYRLAQLPRMHYAYCIYNAALEAKALGYSSLSVIEFGVAGGNGLVNCEFHSKEISRILDLDIEVYGFDSSQGLPQSNMGYKDMIHLWPGGSFHMDRQKLQKRLEFAKLVIGDFKETLEGFLEGYSPAPIGCILVDPDYYSSTLPILGFLEQSDNYFLPRVQMYFDDIFPEYEFQGENLAIKEFNDRNTMIKISPERMYYSDYRAKTKICHRFSHEKYNIPTLVYDGRKYSSNELECTLR